MDKFNDLEELIVEAREDSKLDITPNGKITQEISQNYCKDKQSDNNGSSCGCGNNNSKYCFSVAELKYKENGFEESPVVEVRFKGSRLGLYSNEDMLLLNVNDYVLVESENGTDIGVIASVGGVAGEKHRLCYAGKEIKQKIICPASSKDIEKYIRNSTEELAIIRKAKELVKQFDLDMKVADAEWQYDRQRLTIYFTAPMRIDFRELVKELARLFKTRIELRQISTREETKRLGNGIGCCGNNICCSLFLYDFCHVTLEHARVQQLSNNVSKLSGNCGRLKCCLLFEYDTYSDAFQKYPPLNSTVEFSDGISKITKVDVFKDIVYLYNSELSKHHSITYDELSQFISDGKVVVPETSEISKEELLLNDSNLIIDED
ncbi:MAG: hypothetical protein HW421_2815 [Ignavibacteria bacterium]|nr:hypothetical protein [Ignavibacteria bacterium]